MSSDRIVPAALLGLPIDDDDFQESCLDNCVRDPIAFQEFFFPDPNVAKADSISVSDYREYLPDNHLTIYPSQLPLFLWNVAVHCCGRGVGKSLLGHNRYHVHMAIAYPNSQIGDFAQAQTHVEKLFRDTVKEIKDHPLLACFFDRTLSQDNGSQIFLRNGSYIFFRFPGKSGRNEERARGLQSERASGSSGDEAQNLNATHYQTASNWHIDSPNDVDKQRRDGLFKRLTGVPDGKRDTPLYDADMGKANLEFVRRPEDFPGLPFTVHLRWHLPSPGVGYHGRKVHRDWLTRSGSDLKAGDFTQNYLQDTWGLHGKPAHGLFPRELREAASKHNKFWKSVIILPQEFIGPTASIKGFDANGNLLTPNYSAFDGSLPERLDGPYAFGMDIGLAADTCICAWRYVDERWRWEWLLTLRGWREMEHQCFVVDYLTERYSPIFWGMDQSTLGQSIVSPLKSNPVHGHDYRELIRGFDSSGHYQFEQAEEIVDEWASNQDRVLSESERAMQLVSAQKQAKKQPYAVWTMQRIALLLQRRVLEMPTSEQAPDVHREMDAITMARVQTLSGGMRYEFRPQHPHIVDSLKTFVAGLKLWEAENHIRARTVPDGANAQAMRRLMFGGGLGL